MKNQKIAIKCDTQAEMRLMFVLLHKHGYKKDGLDLFNVFTHEYEFNRGMRYIIVYPNTSTVKLAANIDRRNRQIKVALPAEFEQKNKHK